MGNSDNTKLSRLFIGIDIPLNVKIKELLSELKNNLAHSKIKWVEEHNLHLSLHFLGDVPDFYINSLNHILSEVSNNYPAFNLIFHQLGLFNRGKHPGIIWVGFQTNRVLKALFDELLKSLDQLGIEIRSNNRFKPHLTLGRIKHIDNQSNLNQLIRKYQETNFGELTVKEIILYKSVLKPTGPEYSSLGRHPLKN